MGVVFIEEKMHSPALMDCGRYWGEFFVRFSDFVANHYKKESIFMYEGEVIADFIYVDLSKMQELFEAALQQPERLFMGWAEIVAAMLEVATQEPWREAWQKEFKDFRPSYRGVSSKDIPTFD